MFKKGNDSRSPRRGPSRGPSKGPRKSPGRPARAGGFSRGSSFRTERSESSGFEGSERFERSERPARSFSSPARRPAYSSGGSRPERPSFGSGFRSERPSFGSPAHRPAYNNDRRSPIEKGSDFDGARSFDSAPRDPRDSNSGARSFGSPARFDRSFDAAPRDPRDSNSGARSFGSPAHRPAHFGSPAHRPASFDRQDRPSFRDARSKSFDQDDSFDFENVSFDRPESDRQERPARFERRSFDSGSRPSRPGFKRPESGGRSFNKGPRSENKFARPDRQPRRDEDSSFDGGFEGRDRLGQRDTRLHSPVVSQKTVNQANDLVIGAHPLIELLKAKKRKVISIYTTKPTPKSWERVEPYLPARKPQIQFVERETLDRIAGTTDHMGIVAWVAPFQFRSKPFDPQEKKNILLLDAIQDVRNLGAILRSAHCMGIDGVVLCKGRSAPLTAAAFKASAGLAEHLDIYLAPSLKCAVLDLKKAGYNLYMGVLEDGKNALEVEYKGPMCLVIGNEASGITKEIRGHGELITLPQKSTDISYNASVAAALLMFVLSHGKSIK